MTRTEAIEAMLAECAKHVYDPKTGKGVWESEGANRSAWIDDANRLTNVALGSPWCASFLAKCGKVALSAVYPVTLTASCDVLLFWGRKRKVIYTRAKRGDIGLVLNPSDPDDATHTFIVTEATESGVRTIEGNTNDGGSREGKWTMRRFRPYSGRLVFVRWADTLEDVPETDAAKWTVNANGKTLPVTIDAGTAFVDFSDFMAALYGPAASSLVGWNGAEQTILWGGNPVPQSVPRRVVKGNSFVAVRAGAGWLGWSVAIEGKVIKVFQKEPSQAVA